MGDLVGRWLAPDGLPPRAAGLDDAEHVRESDAPGRVLQHRGDEPLLGHRRVLVPQHAGALDRAVGDEDALFERRIDGALEHVDKHVLFDRPLHGVDDLAELFPEAAREAVAEPRAEDLRDELGSSLGGLVGLLRVDHHGGLVPGEGVVQRDSERAGEQRHQRRAGDGPSHQVDEVGHLAAEAL